MENFTPLSSLIGGALIGASASLLFWLNGRVAGISGIAGGLMTAGRGDLVWRFVFLSGLVAGVALYLAGGGPLHAIALEGALPVLAAGGFLVGFGTRLGGGCTSGHGICGLSRLSPRSAAATVTFMVAAGVTVYLTRHVVGS